MQAKSTEMGDWRGEGIGLQGLVVRKDGRSGFDRDGYINVK